MSAPITIGLKELRAILRMAKLRGTRTCELAVVHLPKYGQGMLKFFPSSPAARSQRCKPDL